MSTAIHLVKFSVNFCPGYSDNLLTSRFLAETQHWFLPVYSSYHSQSDHPKHKSHHATSCPPFFNNGNI